jgi:hypothetical protein
MRQRYMVWTGNFLVIALVALGVWWLILHVAGMPDYKLLIGLVSATGLVLNHFRWRKIKEEIGDLDLLEKVNHIMVANYLVMLLALVLADFRR